MRAEPLTREALAYVCANLREKSHKEALACGWDGDPGTLTGLMADLMDKGVSWFGALENPIYAGGAVEVIPGAWMFWTVATEDFGKIMLSVTKFVRRVMLPDLKRRGAWRIEARCIAGDVEVQKWMELLGAKLESTQEGVGKNGEDFLIYAWSFNNVRR